MKMETTDEIIARMHEAMSDLEDAPKTTGPVQVLPERHSDETDDEYRVRVREMHGWWLKTLR